MAVASSGPSVPVRRMGRLDRRVSLALAMFLGASAFPVAHAASSAKLVIDTKQAVAYLTQLAAQRAAALGVRSGKASCPLTVPVKANAVVRFQCTVAFEGQLAPYVVTIDPTVASFEAKAGMAVVAPRLLAEFVRTNVSGVTGVDCGRVKVIIRPPKALIACAVNGGSGDVSLRVEDTDGRVSVV